MQVKIKQEKQVFKPVTLEITFDTKEELKMMDDMLRLDCSIPELVYENDDNEDRQDGLHRMMNIIRKIVLEAKQGV